MQRILDFFPFRFPQSSQSNNCVHESLVDGSAYSQPSHLELMPQSPRCQCSEQEGKSDLAASIPGEEQKGE